EAPWRLVSLGNHLHDHRARDVPSGDRPAPGKRVRANAEVDQYPHGGGNRGGHSRRDQRQGPRRLPESAQGGDSDVRNRRANACPARSASRTARSPVFRTLVLQFHRWTGLTVGIVLVFMALTGALIAYRPHLEPVVNRDLLTVAACSQHVPLDTLASNARAAH